MNSLIVDAGAAPAWTLLAVSLGGALAGLDGTH